MSVKLNNNPTCVLTDADLYSESQKAKMAKNLMSGLPASTGDGDKVLVLDENGDPQLKDYSAGGGGSSYTAGDGIRIADDTISVKVDTTTIGFNMAGELKALGGSGATLHILDYGTTPLISADQAQAWINAGDIIVAKKDNNFFNLASYSIYKEANNRGMRGNLREDPIEEEVSFVFTGIASAWMSGEVGLACQLDYNCVKFEGGSPSDSWSNAYVNINHVLPEWNGEDDGKVLKIVDGSPTWVTP